MGGITMDKQGKVKANNIKAIVRKITKADNARIAFEGKCDEALKEVIKHFDFDISENRFYIEHQPSDGIVLADDDSNVYHLGMILGLIAEKGIITSYEDLKQLRI